VLILILQGFIDWLLEHVSSKLGRVGDGTVDVDIRIKINIDI
jgi:hypothetical protein